MYLLTPPRLRLSVFAESLAEALDAGGVACVQLRLKGEDGEGACDDDILKACEFILPLCHGRGVPLLINDRPDLVGRSGADGAHVGAGDMPVVEARRLLGEGKVLGVSCYDSRHCAYEAGEGGADYVAFGAFYPTFSKAGTSRPDLEILKVWRETSVVPCVAIGGITPGNAARLREAGADFLAVMSAVWRHEGGVAAAMRAFGEALRPR